MQPEIITSHIPFEYINIRNLIILTVTGRVFDACIVVVYQYCIASYDASAQ